MARGKWRTLLAGTLGLSLALPLLPTGGSIAQADETVYDGHDAAHAAASCYEIKQLNPKATSGVYWLLTDQMSEPQQFFCDQEYDGGGWVLIGRGREGWSESYAGKGSPSELWENNPGYPSLKNADGTPKSVDSAKAFSPVQLPSTTVNALLNNDTEGMGIRPDDLEDGVRIRRALNPEGTAWQDVQVQRTHTERWSWALRSANQWGNISMQSSVEGSQEDILSLKNVRSQFLWAIPYISDINTSNGLNHISFTHLSPKNYSLGFTFGTNIPYRDATQRNLFESYPSDTLMSNTSFIRMEDKGVPLAFTQMYLRPRLMQADLDHQSIADSGTSGFERRVLPNSYSEPVRWRTSKDAATPGTDPHNKGKTWSQNEFHTRVQAFAQIGDTVFLGGDFKYLENSANTEEHIDMPYIGALNVDSQEPVRSFNLRLDGQVKALAALPNNRLAIAGEFTHVNGKNLQGFAVVDATTGELDASWPILSKANNAIAQGRSLSIAGDHLYVGGVFTHAKDQNTSVAAENLLRLSISSQGVDSTWTPRVVGLVTSISARPDESEIYIAGYFTQLDTDVEGHSFRLAALKGQANTDGKVYISQPWDWAPSDRSIKAEDRAALPQNGLTKEGKQWGYQHAVAFDGENVWTGGTEHIISQYRGSELSYRLNSSVTRAGGDFQGLLLDSNTNTMYGSCHCGDFIYHGTSNYNNPWSDNDQVDTIRLVGAFDTKSGQYMPEFDPKLVGQYGQGVWASFMDSRGVLWVGGDVKSSLGAYGMQETVGFARYAQRDATAPEAPGDLKVEHELDGLTRTAYDKLSWQKVGDQKARYQILRNDRVIASTYSTSIRLPYEPNARYFVRAADPVGNYSASTPVATLPALAPGVLRELDATRVILDGSEAWFYTPVSADMPSDWKTQNLKELSGDETWKPAWAPFGWGNASGLKTQLERPKDSLGFYARRSVHLTKAQSQVPLQLITRADDGIALYVNGHEVFRKNLSEGEVRYNSYANAIPDSSKGISTEIVEVPAEYLQEGSNVIAAQVQANWAGSPNLSFSLAAVSLLGRTPVMPAAEGPRAVNTQSVTSILSGDEEWFYRTTISEPVASWNSASEDQWRADLPEDQMWLSGKAPLGWGNAPVNTVVERQTEHYKQELGFYARRSVQLNSEQAASNLQLMTWADDGIVVYVNGHEVFRKNLREGHLSPHMYATAAPDILAERVTEQVTVPAEYLHEGENVIAVQVQANWRRSPNVSFGMTAHSSVPEKAQPEATPVADDAPAEQEYPAQDQPQPEQPIAREEG
ncbi:MAG: fibrinogen-like YCDxxxxGGGW domain-containing protein [Rothia sp. (in: high G+C Gram-positive bacteria)]|uniref:fibrinogen-like YCDxxxxGGGW domain-containing protein n=1 Tax=Rothia sp. (in: high G+C Gram-positive bacteria) TaxID=1885016 RepID=UPI0026DFBCE4|nr:fibrinogen-like YCDxxxxGGGW domain-containing protein [Rothia sp. (in: high G+C Gram-positive bacteria)]MDO5750323.1 fibrinogen-like YCDxxxxGGGW domain-containing protein [Rothia sp. (in: high G+C Gram-positive bacteria)]